MNSNKLLAWYTDVNVNYSNCYFRMMFFTIVAFVALAVKGTSGDLVHGKLYFYIFKASL